jgi:hypothetical protein
MSDTLDSGFGQGIRQGVKTGLGLSPTRTGFSSGINSGIPNKNKMQDPNLLEGEKLPWLYANADLTVDTGGFTAVLDRLKLPEKWLAYKGISIANHPDYEPTAGQIDGTFVRTGQPYVTDTVNDYLAFGSPFSNNNRPYPKIGDQDLGDHVYLDLGGSTGASTNLWLAPVDGIGLAGDIQLNSIAPESVTLMMVMKSRNVAGKTHLWIEDNLLTGGLYFTQPTSTTLQLEFYSANGVSSTYQSSNLQTELQDWMLVTIKCTLKQKNGAGSEQEFYVNSQLQHLFVSSNWTTPEATQTWTSAAQYLNVGGDSISAPVAAGMYFASLLVLPYWANESEQLRLENYFRWYYGKKF